MRALFRIIILFIVIVVVGVYVSEIGEEPAEILINNDSMRSMDESIENNNNYINYQGEELPEDGISLLIGQSKNTIKTELGEPNRIDPSPYGYDWWIYNEDSAKYLQVGIANDEVVTAYVCGSDVNTAPFKIGQSVEEVYSSVLIEPEISLQLEDSTYRFELSEEDMNVRPLIRFEDIFAQLYIDKFSGTLSSIRFIDGPTLIKQQSYELVYRGQLYEAAPISDEEWKQVESGTRQQIFDITNIMRKRYNLQPLLWDEDIAEVAYLHSKDMYDKNYFSHESPEYGDLANRLETADVYYQIAGENIAAQYADAPAAVEGWLNSKGHRETMLDDSFSHLGVGVFKKYYTQNFIRQWVEQ